MHKSAKSEVLSALLYSPPGAPQVNTIAVTDVSQSTNDIPTLPAIMTQGQFNAFKSSYGSTIRRRSCTPYLASGSGGNNQRINPRITCFNCGICGHYSAMCTNPPFSSYEQEQMQE